MGLDRTRRLQEVAALARQQGLTVLAETTAVLVVGLPAPETAVDLGVLSPREREIAMLAGQALTNTQIARRVGRSPHTVNYHLRQIFQKLGIASRVELAALLDRDPGSHPPRS
ncbi:helix-turn-helix transcriptional regulator [Actinoplanes sp. TFC3]|uniref:helix-turn-helix domain-containing protein n=1 Tax=Actinoplanes sp. TFC3 TaxID=1710355 RepID=UPI0009EBFBDD|nr:helix-turn-helix transcriptional regulator [Actinoplanes sp. TFC3]